jgi:hypothetical protein
MRLKAGELIAALCAADAFVRELGDNLPAVTLGNGLSRSSGSRWECDLIEVVERARNFLHQTLKRM